MKNIDINFVLKTIRTDYKLYLMSMNAPYNLTIASQTFNLKITY